MPKTSFQDAMDSVLIGLNIPQAEHALISGGGGSGRKVSRQEEGDERFYPPETGGASGGQGHTITFGGRPSVGQERYWLTRGIDPALGNPVTPEEAYQRLVTGQYLPEDIMTLADAGYLTPSQAQKFLLASVTSTTTSGDSGASGPTALDWAEHEREERWDRYQRVQGYVQAMNDENALAEQRRYNIIDQMIGAAPMLAAGFEHYGGFGPEGGYTQLAQLQGFSGEPISTSGGIMPLNVAGEATPDHSVIEEMLGPLV